MVVYGGEAEKHKPAVGYGLNKTADVTLLSVFPADYDADALQQDAAILDDFEADLQEFAR